MFVSLQNPNLLFFLGSPSKPDAALHCVTDDIMTVTGIPAQPPQQVGQLGLDGPQTDLQPGADIATARPFQD
jgi:hypothetical protein